MARNVDWPSWIIVTAVYLVPAGLIVWATLANFDLGVWLQQFNLP